MAGNPSQLPCVDEMTDEDHANIARLDEKVTGLNDWRDRHITEYNQRFERTFSYVKEEFAKAEKRFDRIDNKLEVMQEERDQRKGSEGAIRWAGMAMWSVVILTVNYFMSAGRAHL